MSKASLLRAKTETDAQFEVKIISPLGEALVAENGKITFTIPGIYTVRATPVQKSLRGAAESEITVKASVADVNAAVKEINDTEDKTTAAIKEKAALLKAAYATLTEEEKGQIDTFDYILAITLESEKENVFYQFDSEVGREQGRELRIRRQPCRYDFRFRKKRHYCGQFRKIRRRNGVYENRIYRCSRRVVRRIHIEAERSFTRNAFRFRVSEILFERLYI